MEEVFIMKQEKAILTNSLFPAGSILWEWPAL